MEASSDRAGFSLTPTRQLRRRKIVGKIVELAMFAAALAAVGMLGLVAWSVFKRGAAALNLDFFTKGPPGFLEHGGGINNSIVGTLVIVSLAAVIAVPIGVMIAIYANELAGPRARRTISTTLDVLNGLPSIVIGIFIFALLIVGHQQSAWAASLALAIIMLPLVARSTQEVLALVPVSLREASLALGASRWRATLGVILPASLGGVFTGATLAVARAAGETAPLLFTCSLTTSQVSWDPRQALQAIPLTIFEYLESPNPEDHAKAWAAALVLMVFVLIVSLVSKAFLARSRRKLSR
jgi:phosphate transport system permease protein